MLPRRTRASRSANAPAPLSNGLNAAGLFPNPISPPYTLFDEASPENPALAGGILTLSTSTNSERMFYVQLEPIVDTSGPFFIEARLRFVSGSSSHPSRGPISIVLTTAPNVGTSLQIDQDRVFFNTCGRKQDTQLKTSTASRDRAAASPSGKRG
jgi:hypothetical protein